MKHCELVLFSIPYSAFYESEEIISFAKITHFTEHYKSGDEEPFLNLYTDYREKNLFVFELICGL